MAKEYIEREAAINKFSDHLPIGRSIRQSIAEVPTVDVAPVRHGKWIITEHSEYGVEAKCSECGYEVIFGRYHIGKYCPFCGAKMDGGNK